MRESVEAFYSKNGKVAQKLAQEFIGKRVGERLPRIDDFVSALGSARGTVQGAMRLLQQTNAVQLESRGHLGTYLIKKDQALLWELAGRGTLVSMMPLPYSRRYEGLATGLTEEFNKSGIPFTIAHMRGGNHRIEALRSHRCDFVVLSRWAAEEACRRYNDLKVYKHLGEQTFVDRHGILFADQEADQIQSGMRVGIDSSSSDQSDLTGAECQGLNVQCIEVNYMQLFRLLENGQIDAAIWNLDEIPPGSPWGIGTFRSEAAQEMSRRLSEASLLIRDSEEDVAEVLETLSFDEVIRIQEAVLHGERVPHY